MSDIKSKADRLGISLGKNKDQIDASISTLLNVEHEREVIFLKSSLPPNDESSESNLVLKRALNICEDLVDDESLNDHADLNETLASIRGRGKKKALSRCAVRRGMRLAIYKKI